MKKLDLFFLLKTVFLSGVLLFLITLNPKAASASVGLVELRSTTDQDYRCFASSLILPNNRYDVGINCVNLIFPANPPISTAYIVWATPINGKTPLKVGNLGTGIARFEVQQPFSALYVTLETNANTRTPSNSIVMNGGIEPIKFLEIETTPTPTPEGSEQDQEKEKTDTSQLSTRDKLLLALRRAGIAAVIALVAIVGLIFVVTRSRG